MCFGAKCSLRMPKPWPRKSLKHIVCLMLSLGSFYVFLPLLQQLLPPSSVLTFTTVSDSFWLYLLGSAEYFKPRSKIISPLHALLLSPDRKCEESTYLVIIIPSPPNDGEWRTVIRKTWGQAVKSNQWPNALLPAKVEIFFILGTSSNSQHQESVRTEAQDNSDIIVGDFEDSYRNLTLKSLTGLYWINQSCSKAKFVMKMDQDTVVDLPRLLDFLIKHEQQLKNSVIGKMHQSSKVIMEGKWAVTQEEYPISMYPTFAGGPCYLLSADTVPRLVNLSQYMPFFHLEDVVVTGILAKILGLHRCNVAQLQNFYEGESLCILVQEKKTQLSLTQLSSAEIQYVWETIKNNTCPESELKKKVTR